MRRVFLVAESIFHMLFSATLLCETPQVVGTSKFASGIPKIVITNQNMDFYDSGTHFKITISCSAKIGENTLKNT